MKVKNLRTVICPAERVLVFKSICDVSKELDWVYFGLFESVPSDLLCLDVVLLTIDAFRNFLCIVVDSD